MTDPSLSDGPAQLDDRTRLGPAREADASAPLAACLFIRAKKLALEVGSSVTALVKATDVALGVA